MVHVYATQPHYKRSEQRDHLKMPEHMGCGYTLGVA